MTRLIRANTRAQAWVAGVQHILDCGGHTFNLILEIANPLSDGPNNNQIHALADDYLRSLKRKPLNAIAETIFPGWSYSRRGFDGMCDAYLPEEAALAGSGKWGTYAERILRREMESGGFRNPLRDVISKMNSVRENNEGKRSCYELDVAPLRCDLATYDATRDSAKFMGQPCLAHLSFKLDGDRIHLTALYRSHDYPVLVLGNLLGLARLQSCVAREVGVEEGTLVVHSTYAFARESKKPILALSAKIEELT